MADKPVAALIRENQFLRDVAEKAIRLRRVGMLLDELDDVQGPIEQETGGVGVPIGNRPHDGGNLVRDRA
ncbi:hypothetical protein [Sinorhizobium psoraleae]|uniref:Transposase n=1 Tax=Sinorhizobium psoraleae TaxID=520838 RepID=A0ABT4KBF4_9HYPH|nr:hypothetical protein [Sinorhizobium psoraleae]MCZ4089305.1 hypothetical protein [Sinorhizobium psoraleae]